MLKSNKILNIISVILIFIIFYSIFNNTIYFKKYENFSDMIDEFKEDSHILKKCPRGCGHHKSVPNCEECGEDKPDYATATLEEREWLNKYHIIGDKAKIYAQDKIKEWRKINKKAIFRFTFLYNNKLHSINIHPNYQEKIYNIYNPGKSINIYNITKWIEKLQLNLSDYSHLEQIDGPNNWTYIDIEPDSWVPNAIYEIVMNNNLASNEYYKTIEKSELEKYNIEITEESEFPEFEKGSRVSKIDEKKIKALVKIFDACDINKDRKISNGEEYRYITLALEAHVRENELEELRKVCKEENLQSACESLTLTELWDRLYDLLTKKYDEDWKKRDYFISLGANMSINKLIDGIEYLLEKELLAVNHDIINSDIEELKKLGEYDINKMDRMMENEESKLINYISKLKDKNKLLDTDKSINFDSRYKDIKERELTETEERERERKRYNENDMLKWEKYNITDTNYNMDLISKRRIKEESEYLKNIGKPLEFSHELAKKRWGIYYKDGMNYAYADKIIENIKNGKGLHIDDILWIFMYKKEDGMLYLNDLISKLEKLNTDIETSDGNIKLTLKPSCISKKDKIIYNEIKLENNSNDDLEISKEQIFWPIFSRENAIDINENILLKNKNECSENTVCGDKSLLANNGIECMFLSKKAKIIFDDKKPGEYWT